MARALGGKPHMISKLNFTLNPAPQGELSGHKLNNKRASSHLSFCQRKYMPEKAWALWNPNSPTASKVYLFDAPPRQSFFAAASSQFTNLRSRSSSLTQLRYPDPRYDFTS